MLNCTAVRVWNYEIVRRLGFG